MAKLDLEKLDLLFTLAGKDKIKIYTLCTENIRRLLEGHPDFEDRIKHDAFTNKTFVRFDDAWHETEDHHSIRIQNEIASAFSFFQKVTHSMVKDALAEVSNNHQYDSGQDFLKSLEWDKVERIDTWLCQTYGVEDNVYHRAVGSNVLKGMVKRVMHPGCKFDSVMVLEGEQGSKKSSSLAVLGGDWYVETSMGTDTKDFFMLFQGKIIIELSEGEILTKTEVKRMKAVISTGTDRYRPPYGRNSVDYPRRCIFIMTTNESQYLKDETGNRRWLPIKTMLSEANIEWLAENRNQLLAEAYHRVIILKETIYEFPKDETMAEQMSRMENDPQQIIIEDWYYNLLNKDKRSEGVTTHQAFNDALYKNFPPHPIKRFEEMIIAGIYRRMGLAKKQVMEKRVRVIRYFPAIPEQGDEPIKSADVVQGELVMDEDEF